MTAWIFTIPTTFIVGYGLSAGIIRFGLWQVVLVTVVATAVGYYYLKHRPQSASREIVGEHAD